MNNINLFIVFSIVAAASLFAKTEVTIDPAANKDAAATILKTTNTLILFMYL